MDCAVCQAGNETTVNPISGRRQISAKPSWQVLLAIAAAKHSMHAVVASSTIRLCQWYAVNRAAAATSTCSLAAHKAHQMCALDVASTFCRHTPPPALTSLCLPCAHPLPPPSPSTHTPNRPTHGMQSNTGRRNACPRQPCSINAPCAACENRASPVSRPTTPSLAIDTASKAGAVHAPPPRRRHRRCTRGLCLARAAASHGLLCHHL